MSVSKVPHPRSFQARLPHYEKKNMLLSSANKTKFNLKSLETSQKKARPQDQALRNTPLYNMKRRGGVVD